MKPTTLVVISPLKGYLLPDGQIVLTRKFIEGMKFYRTLWNGPVLHICEPALELSQNLDNIAVDMETADFKTICAPLSDEFLRAVLPETSLVCTSVGEQFNTISALCKKLGIPCAYIAEYSLRTRYQIIAEYQTNPIKGAWQKLRQLQQEIAQRRAIAKADGVQCNGLPTYQAYKRINKRTHLFFDTRIGASMVAQAAQVSSRYARFEQGRKLHLVFSGRLTLMKGVDDLLDLAGHLREPLKDCFELSICGDGDYAERLRADIDRLGLGGVVKMRGNMDFQTELVPFLIDEADLFVCCHRQGDPSCTYLETMACGVPIIGYDNEAWSQLSEHAKVGWVIRTGDTQAMADQIFRLASNPSLIKKEAELSLDFARGHTFERTFQKRIEHLRSMIA